VWRPFDLLNQDEKSSEPCAWKGQRRDGGNASS